jgi:tetratricopeptide (TPR) repeat protein
VGLGLGDYSKSPTHFTANMKSCLQVDYLRFLCNCVVVTGLTLGLSLGQVTAADAAPRIPTQGSEVLERLPMRPTDATARELSTLRSALNTAVANNAQDPAPALRLAERYFDLALERGDPRYVGYADAVIRPFTASDSAGLWAMRGQLQQYRHGFEPALASFSEALKVDPQFASAHAWRGAIFLVQANYSGALVECQTLQALGRTTLAQGCLGLHGAYTGHLKAALGHLQQALDATQDPGNRLWILTRTGEVQAWRGKPVEAERAYRQALALGLDDGYLLAAWADFLLDQKRPAEVVRLLEKWESSDGLLLRLALAESQLGLPKAAVHTQALADRFEAAKQRNDTTHRAEEARFLLNLRHDALQALKVAAANFEVQREPRDARIVLEAAVAAGNPRAAQPVINWLQTSGFDDPHLRNLAQQVGTQP